MNHIPKTKGIPKIQSMTDLLYAHITALRGDGVNPALLGMGKVASEDSVRRGVERIGAEEGTSWLQGHLDDTVGPLLSEPWVLDCDTTIKPLYGHQEGAVVSYNPKKPGRPSHACHAFLMAGTRLVLDVEVAPGNHHRSRRAAPSLWALLDRLGRSRWPRLVRGDKDWGSEGNMPSCEAAGLDYLFKLRLTKGARRLAERQMARDGWEDAGQGWQGIGAELRLQGWSRSRRVVVLRRRLPATLALTRGDTAQGELFWSEARPGTGVWEFAVLATSVDLEVRSVAQLYRDRADAENGFDELKNQWGWGGFTTRDLTRCRHMARLIALIYNWWSLFVRLADPDRHREAITSRPLLLHGVARQTRHAGQTRLTLTSHHGRREAVAAALRRIAGFFRVLAQSAEQLSAEDRWRRILAEALRKYLHGREPGRQPWLPPPRAAPAC